ncbi:DUF6892 domain-containing protein [Clostridium felsineum]|uniref:DUF6892 domain-containing protein n=1 Tax=Clostridium felsineum TaxID=36839 RepID=UPI00098BF067|nr:hypothetical protein [Clostridium felsineum]URZ04305.1 hypothetical protein CLAUR_043940 [Clostridium felsineum]
MEKYIDKQGLFKDFNFKLVVVDALLDKEPSFEAEINNIKEKYTQNYDYYTEYKPIKEMLDYISRLELTIEDLDKITELYFDGGNEIYFYLQPDWDGEDEKFDIKSVEGFQNLRNLKSVTVMGMVEENTLQLIRQKGIKID